MKQAILALERELEEKMEALIARFEYRQELINKKLALRDGNKQKAQDYKLAKDGE